jgi:NADPH:quinone reductase
MWALVSHEPGKPVELVDVPRPGPGPGRVLIRVAAAAVNPVDLATAAGFLVDAGMMPSRPQTGLGWDVAGVVADIGDGVTRFRPGEQVIGLRDLIDVPLGTFAEYVVLDAGAVAAAPDRLTPAEAATLPLNALTADQALDLLGLAPGRTLLVTGAAGALGGYAVELGARRGLRVVALAAPRDEAAVRGFGAHWFVPRSQEPAAAVRAVVPGGVDAVIDAAVPATGPGTRSGMAVHSSAWRPGRRPFRCAAPGCSTCGSALTASGWLSWVHSPMPACSACGSRTRIRSTRRLWRSTGSAGAGCAAAWS